MGNHIKTTQIIYKIVYKIKNITPRPITSVQNVSQYHKASKPNTTPS